MKKLFYYADDYIQNCDWKDLALIKFCMCAMGLMMGLFVPEKHKKVAFLTAAGVFMATYMPLMVKFVTYTLGYDNEDDRECDIFVNSQN